MEELQDAIEDAQYVNAISSVDDGPRPVLPWEVPTEEQLASWKEDVLSKKEEGVPVPFQFDWTLSHALGFFLFSAYLKEKCDDYVQINFIEEVLRWRAAQGRIRAQITSTIVSNYLSPTTLPATIEEPTFTSEHTPAASSTENGNANRATNTKPPKTEINEFDLAREPTRIAADTIQDLRAQNWDESMSKCCVGLCGPVLDSILKRVDRLRNTPGFGVLSSVQKEPDDDKKSSFDALVAGETKSEQSATLEHEKKRSVRKLSVITNELPGDLFDEAEVIVAEHIREKHWAGFQISEYHSKLLNFLWIQDRKIVEEDFFVMRVLGRGGFGLVTGESFLSLPDAGLTCTH